MKLFMWVMGEKKNTTLEKKYHFGKHYRELCQDQLFIMDL